ncbi:uncharacterized protein LOC117173280 [Belonocnema kinseyi]|uniref:uncharacterized protein LOC117173280 n=1 Tax=Belonocnema kinseyi TaxID=2817044 RepID=UPI00143D6BCE|nr:uncharacterized protein LOC117173280 [Belonocnema kinseyi]
MNILIATLSYLLTIFPKEISSALFPCISCQKPSILKVKVNYYLDYHDPLPKVARITPTGKLYVGTNPEHTLVQGYAQKVGQVHKLCPILSGFRNLKGTLKLVEIRIKGQEAKTPMMIHPTDTSLIHLYFNDIPEAQLVEAEIVHSRRKLRLSSTTLPAPEIPVPIAHPPAHAGSQNPQNQGGQANQLTRHLNDYNEAYHLSPF